ncbi:polyprenyl synthetase family protein [Aestuariibius sp. 2305UL40-4]|uniref:polyprenyl synthetase family protein n=1 Tax=Aestuariibius violaceus TaxID=3234132 RepID=UPI00345E320F
MADAGAMARRAIGIALADIDGEVAEAMRYSTAGGKGFRAFLVSEGARLHGISNDAIAPVAGAIEAIHAYSLVHDDLPCMDDDDMRRGQLTVHRKWDEAIAVLAGDGLQTIAYQLIADADDLIADQKTDLIGSLARASGIHGMVGGQEMDIVAEKRAEPMSIDEITKLQAGKTGALITWSATAGPVLMSSDIAPLKTYGDALGLAFQIADDVLDIEGDPSATGKAVGKDEGRGKATFVSLLGLDGAKRRATELVDTAIDALHSYDENADLLRELARFAVERDR